ncbi:peptidase inhibitor family I36 protein [Streptomyces sp. NBC_00249]|uniref:peptidase inhibitor family I36 protein n=1 Tax=Streptomyces sp. NBC_00249 TaxID=2975690 RepID=UPI00338D574C
MAFVSASSTRAGCDRVSTDTASPTPRCSTILDMVLRIASSASSSRTGSLSRRSMASWTCYSTQWNNQVSSVRNDSPYWACVYPEVHPAGHLRAAPRSCRPSSPAGPASVSRRCPRCRSGGSPGVR